MKESTLERRLLNANNATNVLINEEFISAIKMIHIGEKLFKCKQCDKCFNRRDNLKHHEKIHTGEKPFKCKQCDKCFNRRENFKHHERIHTGEKVFKCKQCDQCFRQEGELKRHFRIHQNEEYICWICQKKLST